MNLSSPFPQDIEIRITEILAKASYLLEKKEFDFLISFLNERVPNVKFTLNDCQFLNVKIGIHFSILFFSLIDLVRMDKEKDIVQKFFMNRIKDVFDKIVRIFFSIFQPNFLKRKSENISLILSYPKILKSRGFLLKYDKKVSEVKKCINNELRNFFSSKYQIKQIKFLTIIRENHPIMLSIIIVPN